MQQGLQIQRHPLLIDFFGPGVAFAGDDERHGELFFQNNFCSSSE